MENILHLSNKNILVTGATSGIGQATCILLSQLGAKVTMLGRNTQKLNQTLQMLEGSGHTLILLDLINLEEIENSLIKHIIPIGGLDGLVHCAGIRYIQPIKYLNYKALEETIRINTYAALYLVKAFRLKGIHTIGSSIVTVSSIMGLVGDVGLSAYSASKGALISLTKSLALELATQNIRINCVTPGYVYSEMLEGHKKLINKDQFEQIESNHPLGIGKPTDVSNSIVFLLSQMSNWITGSTLVVDGGYSAK